MNFIRIKIILTLMVTVHKSNCNMNQKYLLSLRVLLRQYRNFASRDQITRLNLKIDLLENTCTCGLIKNENL